MTHAQAMEAHKTDVMVRANRDIFTALTQRTIKKGVTGFITGYNDRKMYVIFGYDTGVWVLPTEIERV